VSKTDADGWSPLHRACSLGYCNVVQMLVASRSSVHQPTKTGHRPLHMASQEGHCGTVELLLAKRARVNQSRNDGATSLYLASAEGHCRVVEALLKSNAKVNQACKYDGITPLHAAAENGHLKMVQGLLAHGAEHIPDEYGRTAADLAYSELGPDHAVTQYLTLCWDWSLLMHAVAYRKASLVLGLLRTDDVSLKVEVTIENTKRNSFLSLACNRSPMDFNWNSVNWLSLDIVRLISSSLRWSPTSHDLFGPGFRYGVLLILMLRSVLEKQQALPVLPENIWYEIISWLPRSWGKQLITSRMPRRSSRVSARLAADKQADNLGSAHKTRGC